MRARHIAVGVLATICGIIEYAPIKLGQVHHVPDFPGLSAPLVGPFATKDPLQAKLLFPGKVKGSGAIL